MNTIANAIIQSLGGRLSNEERVRHIEETIDHHGRDDESLHSEHKWRMNCRNKNCNNKYQLLSYNQNSYAKEDKLPVLIHGFCFCENCANIIRTGNNLDGTKGKYISLRTHDLNYYTHDEVKALYGVLYGEKR